MDTKYKGYDESDLTHEQIMDLLLQGKEYWADAHARYTENIKFSYSTDEGQWNDEALANRRNMGRPSETYNIINGLVRSVVNLVEQNPPALAISPTSGRASKKIARTISGLIRGIEYNSNAQTEYINGLDNTIRGGIAVYKAVTVMDDFDEDVEFYPTHIQDPTRVWFDPCALKADFSDSEWVITSKDISEKTYYREYPEGRSTGGDANKVEIYELWIRKVNKRTEFDVLSNADIVKKEIQVLQYIFDEHEILEVIREYPSRLLPFAIATGNKYVVDGKIHYQCLTEEVRGVQREINWCKSEAMASIACAPKAMAYGDNDALNPAELDDWANSAVSSKAFLGHKPGKNIKLIDPPQPPVAYMNQADKAVEMARIITGIYPDPAVQAGGLNPLSGKAINAQQAGQAVATYSYVSANNHAIKRMGEILIDLIREYWVDDRVRIAMGVDGSFTSVSIGPNTIQDVENFDLEDDQKYVVSISVGPTYANQKEALIAQIMDLCKTNPQALALCMDWIINNINLPGSEELADRFKLTLPQPIQEYLANKEGQSGDAEEQLKSSIFQLTQLKSKLQEKSAMVDQLTAALDNESTLLKGKEHEIIAKGEQAERDNLVKLQIQALKLEYEDRWREQESRLKAFELALNKKMQDDQMDHEMVSKAVDIAHQSEREGDRE